MSPTVNKCLLLAVLISTAWAFSCPPEGCLRDKCKQLTEVDCPNGIGSDLCDCCDECLKGLGEPCEGIWGHNGKCGNGLKCSEEPFTFDDLSRQEGGKCIVDGGRRP